LTDFAKSEEKILTKFERHSLRKKMEVIATYALKTNLAWLNGPNKA